MYSLNGVITAQFIGMLHIFKTLINQAQTFTGGIVVLVG